MLFSKTENIFDNTVKIFSFGAPLNWKSETIEKIVKLAEKEEVKEVFSLDSSLFNKKIADYREFKQSEYNENGVVLRKGVQAEGTFLETSQAVWLLVADCGVFVTRHQQSGLTVAAHCGRDSLYSLPFKTKSESVVNSIISSFQKELGQKFSPSDLSVYFVGGIGAENFSHLYHHPEKGSWNKKMIGHFKKELGEREWILGDEKEGKLNLFGIVRRQCTFAGIPTENIKRDDSETFSQRNENGELMWHSHRRGSKGRNGILIIRKD